MPYEGRIEGETGVTEQEAVLMLQRAVAIASRVALGDGVDPFTIARILEDEAHAIEQPGDVAEDMSPIKIHMC